MFEQVVHGGPCPNGTGCERTSLDTGDRITHIVLFVFAFEVWAKTVIFQCFVLKYMVAQGVLLFRAFHNFTVSCGCGMWTFSTTFSRLVVIAQIHSFMSWLYF